MTDSHYHFRYVFGPVPSRRLGLSLGVDLIPKKTCSYDCVYCQVGLTTVHTTERRTWIPTEEVKKEIALRLSENPPLDYVTFSGSGEPTLGENIGELIRWVKSNYSCRTAVLTNGSLLWMPEVREDLEAADLVVPSMDSATEEGWRRINKPATDLEFPVVMEGIREFCAKRKGTTWLEILLVEGYNDSDDELEALAAESRALRVERIQVHTVTRPPSEGVNPSPNAKLEKLAKMIGPKCEIVMPWAAAAIDSRSANEEAVLGMLSRRPCTVEDLSAGLSININEAAKLVSILLQKGVIAPHETAGRKYFSVKQG
ncbi:MAG: radical SAM protein [Planctomycetota bacterium]